MLRNVRRTNLGMLTKLSYRFYSQNLSPKLYYFEQIKQFVENPKTNSNKILVDVREPNELEEYCMPHSINIPLKSSPEALGMSKEQFEDTFHFPKPNDEHELIFFCAKGIRAKTAESIARWHGYKHTGIYTGSIADWLANSGDKIKSK